MVIIGLRHGGETGSNKMRELKDGCGWEVGVNGSSADVCIYRTSRPAGYKIMGIDTKRENTSMFHRPKGGK